MYKYEINVNELNSILQKHFKCKEVYTDSVSASSMGNQHNLKHEYIGIGGQLNIKISLSRKIKNAERS